jgi:hypothetical protein
MRKIALWSPLRQGWILMRLGLWPLSLAVLLLTGLHSVAAVGEPLFDESKRVVLPSKAAAPILERRRAGNDWTTSEWSISTEDLDHLEGALAVEMEKAGNGISSFKTHEFYRQYMPARWKGLNVIIVNGFDKSVSDLFPDRGIAPDQWKHELVTTFGGGCAYWYAVYVVEQNRLMVLKNSDGSRHATLICNAPK